MTDKYRIEIKLVDVIRLMRDLGHSWPGIVEATTKRGATITRNGKPITARQLQTWFTVNNTAKEQNS